MVWMSALFSSSHRPIKQAFANSWAVFRFAYDGTAAPTRYLISADSLLFPILANSPARASGNCAFVSISLIWYDGGLLRSITSSLPFDEASQNGTITPCSFSMANASKFCCSSSKPSLGLATNTCDRRNSDIACHVFLSFIKRHLSTYFCAFSFSSVIR